MTIPHDRPQEWPTVQQVIDPHLERDEALNELEQAWRSGALIDGRPPREAQIA